MLHLRILVPPVVSPRVLDLLSREPEVVHISHIAGAAVDPGGDLVEADVTEAGLAAVLSRLDDLGVPRVGSYSFSDLMDVRSDAADEAQRHDRALGGALIAWDEVAARTREDVSITPAFLLLMVLAGIIAAVGILTDNELLIVGAMIVSPDYGPLAALCVAIVADAPDRVRMSGAALVAGFAIAGAAAAVVSLLAIGASLVPEAYIAGTRPVTQLIASPNPASLLVAVAAGVAGIVGLGRAKSGAVVGVLVSVTTIPAAANIGVALPFGNLDEAFGAAAQLVINLGGMIAAGVGSLWLGRRLTTARAVRDIQRRRQAKRRTGNGRTDPG